MCSLPLASFKIRMYVILVMGTRGMMKNLFFTACGMMLGFILCMSLVWGEWKPFSALSHHGPLVARRSPFESLSTLNLTNNHTNKPVNPVIDYSASPPTQRWQDTLTRGYLNYDVWHWIVGYLVDDMRITKEFPLDPDERGNISRLHIKFNESDPADLKGRYSHRIYGYLIPPIPGNYSFKVELSNMTAAGSVELWINNDKILYLVYDDTERPEKRVPTSRSNESRQVMFGSGVYFFEFYEKAFEGNIVVDVKWKTPGSETYVSIPNSSFAMAARVSDGDFEENQSIDFLLDGSLPSETNMTHKRVNSNSTAILPITHLSVLPHCHFQAKYAYPRKIRHKSGASHVHETRVYPKDSTWYYHFKKADRGNILIAQDRINSVMSLYKKAFQLSKLNGTVKDLRYLEQTFNDKNGSRYLLELDIQLHQKTVHTSEYVYLNKNSTHLCHTSNFQWAEATHVYLAVSVKNLALWIRHLIYNMEEIYEQTGDEHFSLIIVDCESEDMDIEQEAQESSFPRITVLHHKGNFTRSGGLQDAIDYVKDNNSIVITIDMHLSLPKGFIEYARKHTIQGKMAFTPMFFKLNKGYTELNYNGWWGIFSYGIFSMFKSDWVRAGGFNTVRYTTKWGDEDVDMLDRTLSLGMEAFRIRVPGFVHYHHTRMGMWGSKDIQFKSTKKKKKKTTGKKTIKKTIKITKNEPGKKTSKKERKKTG